MKTQQAYQINPQVLKSENFAVKYMSRQKLVYEVVSLVEALEKLGVRLSPNDVIDVEKATKAVMVQFYEKYSKVYTKLYKKQTEEKTTEKVKEVKKVQQPKEKPVESCHRGTAAQRLEKYSKELEEKQALLSILTNKEEIRAVNARIRSLGRKIARANKSIKA